MSMTSIRNPRPRRVASILQKRNNQHLVTNLSLATIEPIEMDGLLHGRLQIKRLIEGCFTTAL